MRRGKNRGILFFANGSKIQAILNFFNSTQTSIDTNLKSVKMGG
jgi:hypothetical protein